MAGEVPVVSVAIAFDSGFSTPIASRTYTDVSAYVDGDAGVSINYGRADERSTVDPSTCSLTLNNADGRFTPEKASSPYYPNVKKGKPIQVSLRYPSQGSGNLLSANAASMETSVVDWSAGGTVPPTLSWSNTRADVGTRSLLVTWGTAGSLPLARTTVSGLVVGRTYTAQARVWVPTGAPNVLLVAGTGGSSTATKNAWATISRTFTATSTTQQIQVWPSTAPVAGQQVWVDSVMVDEGSSVGTFTTSPLPSSVRFTGYVDEWPLTWPTGSDATANMTISCTSRRARLGKTAALVYSPISYAYGFPTWPQAYWRMDGTRISSDGLEVFIDATNIGMSNEVTESRIWIHTTTEALQPVFDESLPGPVDEGHLLKFPAFTDSGLVGTQAHYVGAGGACKVNTAGELTFEMVARVDVPTDMSALIRLFQLVSSNGRQVINASVADYGLPVSSTVAFGMTLSDDDTGTTITSEDSDFAGFRPDMFLLVNDGEIHHYAFTLTGGNVGKFYVDGTLLGTLTLSGGNVFAQTFTSIVLGSDTYNAPVWIGHVAIRDEALSAADIAAHAAGATTRDETIEERLERVLGYMGVPTSEVSAETSVALPVGDQAQVGRAPAEVADELAASTGGVLYDKRDGTITMQARNHRYNQTSAFSLSVTAQEVEVDLNPVLDDRYLVNYITVTRSQVDDLSYWWTDPASVAEYGTYSQTLEMVTSSWEEARAAALSVVSHYAVPKVRISTASVDVVDLSAAQQVLILAADIGTLFTITGLPTQAPATSMPLYLEGYSESISAAGHTLTMNTTPGDWDTNVLVLDDAAHDVLDSGVTLAY